MSILGLLSKITLGGQRIVYRAVQGMVWKGGYTFERFAEFDRTKKHDVIILGSSRANRGLRPEPFEAARLSFYNLGTDDQTPVNTNVLVRRYINKDNCRLVIFDAYDKVFCQDPLESTSDLIQNFDDNYAAMLMAIHSRDLRSLNCFGVRMILRDQQPEYKGETDLINGFRKDEDKFHFSSKSYYYKTSEIHLKAFDEMLKYLNEIGVPLIVVSQPLPLMPVNHRQFVNDITPIIQKHNVPFYDFTAGNDLLTIDDFADMSHFNSKGALIYSQYISDSIAVPFFKHISVLKNEKAGEK